MTGKKLVPAVPLPEWLPEGWSVEYRKRRFSKTVDKYHIHPSSAKKLRSKPEVMRFLSREPNDVNLIAFQKAASYQKSHEQHHKQLVQIDHCPSDLPEGWMVEKRLRRSGHHKGQVDSYYIDPIYGHKFRSKTGVSRYLKNQEVRRLCYQQKKMHSRDTHLLKEEGAPPLIKFEKFKEKQTSTSKHLILTKEQTLIEYIKSKVKRTVTRRCLVLTKEPICSPNVDSLKGPVPSLLLETSTRCTESNCANPPLKLAPRILLDAPTKLEVDSAEKCTTTTTIKDIENLEQRLGNFRIECHENCGECGKGQLPFEGQWLDLRQKQQQKRKANAEFDLPSKYLKQANGSREECGHIIDQDYQREMSIPSELEEKLEKLQLVVEQASNVKREDTTDELFEKLGKLNLSRACMGDLWLDPCIEFAYKTLTSDSLVLEDVANTSHPND